VGFCICIYPTTNKRKNKKGKNKKGAIRDLHLLIGR
jgi:hypothetical protein